ncbi:hypothetical protein [Leptospira alstonii]|uniref:hypothetical protein n=1 Tax=Leptospira alstonii TaxID=28452 RepID=UPI0009D9B5DA|nr:hypothetical protein [Leptospira alstonii]
MNPYSLRWKVFLKVSKKENAVRILSKMEETFDRTILTSTCEKYWKDETLYEANFRISLDSKNITNTVFQSLLLSQKLGRNWCVLGPIETLPNKWSFEGICNQPNFLSLNWARFEIESK